ncbi:hypothetical protein GPECTOR_24g278 [Gonium pectorale]|uniref:Uncharacterized protein n=1 Tax=Gonium pectorale TaxID=33097 RepID=A0A150GGN8_GONPE|nr:hypothetical protein GPECTOR_24g278 [Gonium pectorale]|eukprot:KXZ48988.1 hypothetical protein GPECTOR_24g278 [Gonium pectorale]
MWALSLSGLAPSALIRVPAGATLELRGITLVLSRADLTSLFTALCRDTGAWPHSPGVTMDDGTIRIGELDTTAPGPDGTVGGGGEVRWRDVLITCNDVTGVSPPQPGLWKPYPCAARPVGAAGGGDSGGDGGGAEELQRASSALLEVTQGPVFLSLTSNISLASGFGLQNVITRGSVGRLVLRGPRGAATTLDLAGREDAWVWEPPPSASPNPTYAYVYDMTLVNLPYSSHPGGPADLMALATLGFGVRPPPGGTGDIPGPRLRLTRCTLVLPDDEVAFLRGRAEAAGQVVELSPAAAPGWLAVRRLELQPAVLLLNCTLLSASAYAALPGAVPLLPQSRVWPPLLLHANRTQALLEGPSGLAVAPGLEAALAVQERVCGREGEPVGGAAVTFVARRDDDTVSPADRGQDREGGIAVGGREADPGFGLLSHRPGSPAAEGDVCTISGYAPELVGGRTFTDLKGAAGRRRLARPLRLRNLVLYNLAPGGSSGPPLEGADAGWANSSLPLWYFRLPRSASPDDEQAPLLLLDNVTLVVPELEWRALAAAMLTLHAPQALATALRTPRAPPRASALPSPSLPPPAPGLPQPPAAPPYPRPSNPSGPTTSTVTTVEPLAPEPPPSQPSPPLAPPPPSPRPAPPSPPPSPPSPPFSHTRGALLAFAAASVPVSLDSSSGVLVLASARHYGWYGTHVTITCTLPQDAPPGASLLPYSELMLPYQELAVGQALAQRVAAAWAAEGQERPGQQGRGGRLTAAIPWAHAPASAAGSSAATPLEDAAFLQDVSVYFCELRDRLGRREGRRLDVAAAAEECTAACEARSGGDGGGGGGVQAAIQALQARGRPMTWAASKPPRADPATPPTHFTR